MALFALILVILITSWRSIHFMWCQDYAVPVVTPIISYCLPCQHICTHLSKACPSLNSAAMLICIWTPAYLFTSYFDVSFLCFVPSWEFCIIAVNVAAKSKNYAFIWITSSSSMIYLDIFASSHTNFSQYGTQTPDLKCTRRQLCAWHLFIYPGLIGFGLAVEKHTVLIWAYLPISNFVEMPWSFYQSMYY